ASAFSDSSVIRGTLLMQAGTRTILVNTNGGTLPALQIQAAITGGTAGIDKTGIGELDLEGNNSFGGLLTVSSGTVTCRSLSALGVSGGGTLINTGAVLQVEGNV